MGAIKWQVNLVEGELDGKHVKIKCRYWAKDVVVEMLEPYPGEEACLHLLYSVPFSYTTNGYWRKAAWSLAKDIFKRVEWTNAHEREVKARRVESARRIAIVNLLIGILDGMRIKLRKCFKRGDCGAKAYQQTVRMLNATKNRLLLLLRAESEPEWISKAMREETRFASKCDSVTVR